MATFRIVAVGLVAALLFIGPLSLGGCNTIEGAAEDLENLDKAVREGTGNDVTDPEPNPYGGPK